MPDSQVSVRRVAEMRSFYVRTHAADDYNLGDDIVSVLQEMGYRAVAGPEVSPPDGVDGVITYLDRWTWGFTLRMLRLDMQLREPGSDSTLATSNATRYPGIDKPQKEIIREALAKLLKDEAKSPSRRR